MSYEDRHEALKSFCETLAEAWAQFEASGHPLEVGSDFIEQQLPGLLEAHNAGRAEPMPWLAALVCNSLFDIALHDAYGRLHDCDIYETYNAQWMNRSLEQFLEPADGTAVDFTGQYPADYFEGTVSRQLPAWHLVGEWIRWMKAN